MRSDYGIGHHNQVVKLFQERFGYRPITGIEIGTSHGCLTKTLLSSFKNLTKLYTIDPWIHRDGVEFEAGLTQKYHNETKAFAFNALKEYEGRVKILEMTSDEAVKIIKEKVDFVWIDGDHEEGQVVRDLENYDPLVKKGGLIGGHDWGYAERLTFRVKQKYGALIHLGDDHTWWVNKLDEKIEQEHTDKVYRIEWLRRWQILYYLIDTYHLKRIAEVGMWHGDTARRILQVETMFEKDFELEKYFMIDIEDRPVYHELMEKYKCAEFMHLPSVEAAKQIQDMTLGLVFIDGDHSYKSVKADILAWWPKVCGGGFLVVHDFGITKEPEANFPQGPRIACMEIFKDYNLFCDQCPGGIHYTFWVKK